MGIIERTNPMHAISGYSRYAILAVAIMCGTVFAGEYKVSIYDGPDYWEGMIRRAKKFPYYKDNVIFVMGTDSKPNNVPSADRVMRRASYVIHDLPQATITHDRPDLVAADGEVLLVDSLVTNPGLSTSGFFTEVLSTLADGVRHGNLWAEPRVEPAGRQWRLHAHARPVAW